MPRLYPTVSLLALSVAAACWDWRWRRVPNTLVFPAMTLGLVGWFCMVRGLMHALAGAAMGLVILIVPWSLGWTGGGDVKFLAAVGALGGAPFFVVRAAVAGMVLGGLWALAALARQRGVRWCVNWCLSWALGAGGWPPVRPEKGSATAQTIPYAVPLAAGVLLTLALGERGWWW